MRSMEVAPKDATTVALHDVPAGSAYWLNRESVGDLAEHADVVAAGEREYLVSAGRLTAEDTVLSFPLEEVADAVPLLGLRRLEVRYDDGGRSWLQHRRQRLRADAR